MTGQTILVADDDAASRLVLSHALTTAGYQVMTAKDGREALGLFTEHVNDICMLITDCFMPEILGVDLARMIREKFGRGVPIVMISSLEFSFPREELHASGVDHVLDKPFSPKAVCKLVREILAA